MEFVACPGHLVVNHNHRFLYSFTKDVGGWVAILTTFLMLLTLLYPTFFEGGNLTETYALLPIVMTLGAYWGNLNTNKRFYLLGIGLFTAIAFLFKPIYISMGLAASLILAYRSVCRRQLRQLASELGLIIAGVVLPLFLVAAYWVVQGDLYDLVYAVFIHNRLYVQEGFSLKAFRVTLRILTIQQPLASLSSLAIISISTWAVEN